MFPLDKYKYYVDNDRRIYAVSSYAGKTVKGVAKCHEKDTFSLEKGKRIAAFRCGLKIAARRQKRAIKAVEEAMEARANAEQHYAEMKRYYHESIRDYAYMKCALEEAIKGE